MQHSKKEGQNSIRLIGVGNIYRGDDAVGIRVAQQLAQRDLPGVEFLERSGEGTALMEAIKGCDAVYLVDALQSGANPGEILRIAAHDKPLPSYFSATSTHAFGVAEAVEMARLMGELPAKLIIFGIEGQQYETGQPLSPEVEAAIPTLVEKLCQELQS
jgi:hydrogenase maturation protease